MSIAKAYPVVPVPEFDDMGNVFVAESMVHSADCQECMDLLEQARTAAGVTGSVGATVNSGSFDNEPEHGVTVQRYQWNERLGMLARVQSNGTKGGIETVIRP